MMKGNVNGRLTHLLFGEVGVTPLPSSVRHECGFESVFYSQQVFIWSQPMLKSNIDSTRRRFLLTIGTTPTQGSHQLVQSLRRYRQQPSLDVLLELDRGERPKCRAVHHC